MGMFATYTVNDLVPILHMKPRAIRRLIATDQLFGRMVGRQFLVTQTSLKEFLGEGEPAPTQQQVTQYMDRKSFR
jgi:hypothetical protein